MVLFTGGVPEYHIPYIMKTGTNSYCGLDLQRGYFSIIQYSTDERAVNDLSIHQPFSDRNGADQWKMWKNELKKSRGRLRFFSPIVICGMPAQYAVVKLVPIDSDEQRVEDAVAWELGQHIGGPIEEYSFDFQEAEAGPRAEERKVLAVAYRRELVNRMADIVRGTRMRPQVVDLDIFGLVNVFSANYSERSADTSLLVHSEPDMTKLVLTRNGGFMNCHCFEHTNASVDPAGFAAMISAGIDRFLGVSEANGRRPGIYLTGSYFQESISYEAFCERMPGAEILDPFRTIKCQVQIDEQQSKKYSTQLAIAVGLALRGTEMSGRDRDTAP
ncbi:MAG: pilus assembly protein PilM [Chitinispirillaceae bacterium]|nr:pilus assembly protein PilM [Chitinispirillaceae bacterium]